MFSNNNNNTIDDNILYYSNDNISFNIRDVPMNVKSPYLNSNKPQGNMTFSKQTETKGIDYEGILNILNVRLNGGGKLEVKNPNIKPINNVNVNANINTNANTNTNTNTNNVKPYQSAKQNKKIDTNKAQTSLKNENFYKYFKSHNLGSYIPEEEKPIEEVKPLTREEYIEHRRKKALEEQLQRERIRQIKSRNMFFNSGQQRINPIQSQNRGDQNKLFNFSIRR